MAQPLALWNSFCSKFHDILEQVPDEDLVSAWASHSGRTAFYRKILQQVSEGMGLAMRREVLHVDFTFCDKDCAANDLQIPVVFLETENNAFRCYEEIQKLVVLAAPLKILIAVVEWDETPGVWAKGSRRKELLAKWQTIVRAHDACWPRSGLTGIVVGERRDDNYLCFHACALSSNGELIATIGKDGEPAIHQRIFGKPLDWHLHIKPQ